MPQIQDLREYNEKLLLVGNEAAIQEERGIRALVVDPPEADQIASIVAVNALKVRKAPSAAAAPPPAATSPLDDLLSTTAATSTEDFSDLFGDSSADQDAAGEDDFFSDLFGDQDPAPADDSADQTDLATSPEEEALLDDFLNAFGDENLEDEELEGEDLSDGAADADLQESAPAQEPEPAPQPESDPLDLDDSPLADDLAAALDFDSDFDTSDFDTALPTEVADELPENLFSMDPPSFGSDLADETPVDFSTDFDADFTTDAEPAPGASLDDDISALDAALDLPDDQADLSIATDASLDDLEFSDTTQGATDLDAALDIDAELEQQFDEQFNDEFAGEDEFSGEFSMQDFGADFGILEESEQVAALHEEEVAADAAAEEMAAASASDQAGGWGISEKEYDILRKVTDLLPLNVKSAVAEIISDPASKFDDVKELVQALAAAETPRRIAAIASKISGKRIVVPKGYEKRTGLAFAEEQEGFLYQFRHRIWPALRLGLLASAALSLVIFLSYNFIYRPVHALDLYNQGLAAIADQQYQRGNNLFDRAWATWEDQGRFLQYADAFEAKRQAQHAEDKYEELLALFPLHREGILKFADFLAFRQGRHQEALDVLQRLLDIAKNDFDPLLKTGDIYLDWARSSPETPALGGNATATSNAAATSNANSTASADGGATDNKSPIPASLRTQHLEAARSAYLRLSEMYGQTDTILFRLLLYFVRAQDLDRAFRLSQDLEADPRTQIEAGIYAETAGYFLDTWVSGQTTPILSTGSDVQVTSFAPDLLEEAQALLLAALEQDTRLPEIHYQLARSYAEQERWSQERLALNSAKFLFEAREGGPAGSTSAGQSATLPASAQPATQSATLPTSGQSLSRFERAQYIDTLARLGESEIRQGNLLSGEQELRRAAQLYERNSRDDRLRPQHTWGRIYADLGDLYYFEGNDYAAADNFYRSAIENGYGIGDRPRYPTLLRDLQYRLAFIAYGKGQRENYAEALDLLYKAEGPAPAINPNLVFAQANTQFQLGNYSVAAALYQRVVNRLIEQRESIVTFLLREDDTHRALIDFLIRGYNNLGVALFELSRSAGVDRVRRQIEAQYYLSKATELAENVERDDATAVRSDARNLAFLNLRAILVPRFEGQVLLDPDIPKDIHDSNF